MLNITLSAETCKALHVLRSRQQEDNVCFRLREFVSGCVSCRSEVRRMLRLTLDETQENDLTVEVEGLPFVMDELLLANYGNSFFISLDKNKMPMVTALRPLFQ